MTPAKSSETLKRLRDHKPLLPTIVVTSRSAHQLQAAREEGISVMEKPFDISYLLKAIDTIPTEVKAQR